ncbi:hypothetical protein [Paenibacillus marchantiophytorum]|uniref:hypothetical protein n=1 Tax=Paenibacillus marchantiophytorum TaxID=1619310 RepID=UPI0016659ACB|nr:hypothetical protein [Paenibacillus marchantiophytorum]
MNTDRSNTTELTMAVITIRIDYDHTYPFFRFFKSISGSSPGKYKKALTRRLIVQFTKRTL